MRFTIKLKLFLTFGFMLAVLVGTAAYGIISLGGLNTTLGDVLSGPAERLKLAQTLNNLQLQQIRQQILGAFQGQVAALHQVLFGRWQLTLA